MSSTRPKSARSPSRSSTALLLVALAATVAVAVLGSIAVWGLYGSAYADQSSGAPAAFAGSAQPLRVGLARSPGGPGEWITFARVFAQMQRDLKRPVVIRYVLSSEDQTHLFQRGQIDVALMSTLAYMDEQAAGRVTLIGTPVVLGEPMDAMFVVVRDDSKARRIEDLRGKRFAVSQDLAGVSFVYWLLKKRGENPDGFFSATPTDVQDENLKKVAKGEVDGTSVRRSALAAWPEGTFRIIERSPELGMPPIVASKSLDEATVDQVRQSLLHAAARGVIPVGSVVTGFRAANDSEYDFARVLDATDRRLEQKAFGSAHQ